MAGVKIKWYYHTAIDPPELVRFIRQYHSDVEWTIPKKKFFQTVSIKGMPSSWYRVCCSIIKEGNGRGRLKVVGVRAEESARRAASWDMVSPTAIAPILHWTTHEVWEFIHANNLPYCCLYDEGFDRLGCVGCPLKTQAKRNLDFARWPRYERFWQRICSTLWEKHKDDEGFSDRQKKVGFLDWEDHWKAWRGDMRAYMKAHKMDNMQPCGDNDLTRYME